MKSVILGLAVAGLTSLAPCFGQVQTNQLESAFHEWEMPRFTQDMLYRVPEHELSNIIVGEKFVYTGLFVQVVKTPKNLQLLHLINPFAPREYGVNFSGTPTGRPHAFTDPKRHEPNLVLFSIGR
jgi:hypothetical protein